MGVPRLLWGYQLEGADGDSETGGGAGTRGGMDPTILDDGEEVAKERIVP